MSELSTFISSQGFPITIACGLMYGFYVVIKLLINRIIVAFDTITEVNKELTKTNSLLANELRIKIANIDSKLDKALQGK